MNILRLSLKNVKRQSAHSLRCIIVIAVSLIVVSLLFGFVAGMEKNMLYNIRHYLPGDITIRNAEYNKNILFNPSYLRIQDSAKMKKALISSNIAAVSRCLVLYGSIVKEDAIDKLRIFGVDMQQESKYQNWEKLSIEGRVPQKGKKEILLGTLQAKKLGMSIGDQLPYLEQQNIAVVM